VAAQGPNQKNTSLRPALKTRWHDPTFKIKANIKLEHMPEGKAPRFLIADGDTGQIMAIAMTVDAQGVDVCSARLQRK
jgi:hypothetical protein